MEEWVEVKGATVDVAVTAGLSELGIDKKEFAEIEILQEPEKGFLGIGRQDAIVRVKPKPKSKRKRSRNRRGKGDGGPDDRQGNRQGNRSGGKSSGNRGGGSQGQDRNRRDQGKPGNTKREKTSQDGGNRGGRPKSGGERSDQRGRGSQGDTRRQQSAKHRSSDRGTESETVDINEQAEVIEEFLSGLLGAFGLDGTVVTRVDDDVIYADIDGEQTEALIGPRATILQAIHELTKTVVQRKTMSGARLRLDIGGYAERRRTALTIYATQLAEQVIDDDAEIMLEAMNPADRKTVHDAVSDIEGVRSFSEGEEPNRSVVVAPTD